MISGRVWKFGDNINTDLMLPSAFGYATEEQQKRAVFSANRPGWVDLIHPGDIIVGGKNYGIGSSRPAARSLRNLGLGCLLAESINGLFFRNAVNFGFVALECPGVYKTFVEGDVAELSLEHWQARNWRTGVALAVRPIPAALLAMMESGGIYPMLEREGFVSAEPIGKRQGHNF
jgi:3-isopropylmalate/(R)-2-methylmalate dehydratase small subunit